MTTIRRMDITTAEHRERVSLVGEALTAYRAMAAFDRSIELDPALGDAITKIGDREVPDDLYERAAGCHADGMTAMQAARSMSRVSAKTRPTLSPCDNPSRPPKACPRA